MNTAYTIVKQLLLPECWILGCLLAAWWWSRTANRLWLARKFLILAIVLFYGLGLGPLEEAFIAPLESQYPPFVARQKQAYDAIVVLGGKSARNPHTGSPTILGYRSASLLICGIMLWRDGVAPTLVLVGGTGDPLSNAPPVAEAMQDLAMHLGMPPTALLTETRSRTTAEFLGNLRQAFPAIQRMVLVDSASHLPRAIAVARHEGFVVTAAPCDYEVTGLSWTPYDLFPSSNALDTGGKAIHEYIGILWYWVRGKL